MDISTVDIRKKEEQNIIIGQAHFIKSVEDLFEAMAPGSDWRLQKQADRDL